MKIRDQVKLPIQLLFCTILLAGLASPQPLSYTISTFVGGGTAGSFVEGKPATSFLIQFPYKPAADAQGNLYFSFGNRVLRVGPDGIAHTFAGTGTAGFSGDSGPASSATLNTPSDVALDVDGGLLIADAFNYRIRKVDLTGRITTVAGTGLISTGQNDGDNGPAKSARVWPSLMTADRTGLYFMDRFRTIRRIRPDGVIVLLASGRDTVDAGQTLATNQLYRPGDLASDGNGTIYVVDFLASRLLKMTQDGTLTTIIGATALHYGFAGDGSPAARATLNWPTSVAVDSAGNVHIVDSKNNRVRTLLNTPSGSAASGQATINTSLGNGSATATLLEGTPAASTSLPFPNFVMTDPMGNIFVTDTSARYRRFRLGGSVQTVAGVLQSQVIGDAGPLTDAELMGPEGLFIDPAGSLYIADTGFNRIRKVTAGGVLSTAAGTDGAGSTDGPATQAVLGLPLAVVRDRSGNLFTADFNINIRRVAVDGSIATLGGYVPGGSDEGRVDKVDFHFLHGLAIDTQDNVYVACPSAVRKITPDGTVTRVAGTNSSTPSPLASGSAKLAGIQDPQGMTFDKSGNLYIADTQNHRILRVTPDGQFTTIAGTYGAADFSGDGGLATQARFNQPSGLAFDDWGNLYVVDDVNDRVRKITPDGKVNTIAGNGHTGFSGDQGPATLAMLGIPAFNSVGVAADAAGNVYFSDLSNSRIRKLTAIKIQAAGLLHAATLQSAGVAAGLQVVLNGTEIGPVADSSGGVRLLFDGVAADLISTSMTKIVAAVPQTVAGQTTSRMEVEIHGARTNGIDVPVAAALPGIFTVDSSGAGQATAQNADGSVNSPDSPAPIGSAVVISVTGLGGADASTVMASIDGIQASVLDISPGATSGVSLLTLIVPDGAGSNSSPNAVPAVVTVGSANSQAGVTLAVASL